MWRSCSVFVQPVSGGYDHLILTKKKKKTTALNVSVHVAFMVSVNILMRAKSRCVLSRPLTAAQRGF